MIEINLLPGAKKVRGGGLSLSLGPVADAVRRVADPMLAGAAAAVVAAALFVGGTYMRQTAREASVAEREERAVADSARYAVVLRDRAAAVAQRDSVAAQLRIIRAIDNNRFVWPHVMDEVSRALPPYTWLTAISQTSAPTMVATADTAKPKGAKGAKAADAPVAAADTAPPPASLKFRIVGNTVDIQALTRFMKDLEASPFVRNVTLDKSDLVSVDGKEVTQFQLDCDYQTPEPSAVRMVPVSFQAPTQPR